MVSTYIDMILAGPDTTIPQTTNISLYSLIAEIVLKLYLNKPYIVVSEFIITRYYYRNCSIEI